MMAKAESKAAADKSNKYSAQDSAIKAKKASSDAADESNRRATAKGAKEASGDATDVNNASVSARKANPYKPPGKEPSSSEAPKKSYADEKMDAVRRAMSESGYDERDEPKTSSYEMRGAPKLGSSEPMSDLPTGKFGADGDDWTYEVSEDGRVIASIGGKSIPVKEGTDAYEEIVAQLKSGQLSSIESEDVTEEV